MLQKLFHRKIPKKIIENLKKVVELLKNHKMFENDKKLFQIKKNCQLST